MSEWEMFLSALLFAIGIASGLLLTMALGWISMAVVCLRPAQTKRSLAEWFKIPFLALFLFPWEIDFAGSRHHWFNAFVTEPIAWPAGPALFYTLLKLQLTLRLTVFLFAILLTDLLFWLTLPAIPLVLLLSARLAVWAGARAPWAEAIPLLLVPAAAAMALRCGGALLQNRAGVQFWGELRRWAGARTYSIWLVGIVVALQQSSLIEHWLGGSEPRFDLPGAMIFLALLWRARRHTPDLPVQFESKFLLAAALYFLLAAEWSDSLVLRRLSLGALLMSAASWHRCWSWKLNAPAAAAWMAFLPSFNQALVRIGFSPTAAVVARASLAAAALAVMALTSGEARKAARRLYADSIWMPNKRFALTLLFLLLTFQTFSGMFAALRSVPPMTRLAARRRVALNSMPATLEIFSLEGPPLLAVAPEWTLRARGWRVVSRKIASLPTGEAEFFKIENSQGQAQALAWFDNRQRIFPGYLTARHVLWSGWSLANRDLRLAVLIARNRSPGFAALAASQWRSIEEKIWPDPGER